LSALLLPGKGVTEEERRLLPRGGITEEERRLLPAWEGVTEEEMTTLQESVAKEERLLLGLPYRGWQSHLLVAERDWASSPENDKTIHQKLFTSQDPPFLSCYSFN